MRRSRRLLCRVMDELRYHSFVVAPWECWGTDNVGDVGFDGEVVEW